jgi:hypothetical protein
MDLVTTVVAGLWQAPPPAGKAGAPRSGGPRRLTISGSEGKISSAIGSDLRERRMPWDRTSDTVWMPSSTSQTAGEGVHVFASRLTDAA